MEQWGSYERRGKDRLSEAAWRALVAASSAEAKRLIWQEIYIDIGRLVFRASIWLAGAAGTALAAWFGLPKVIG